MQAEVKLYIKAKKDFDPGEFLFDFLEKVYEMLRQQCSSLTMLEAELIAANIRVHGRVHFSASESSSIKPLVVDIITNSGIVNLCEIRMQFRGVIETEEFETLIEKSASVTLTNAGGGRIEMSRVKWNP